MTYAEIALKRVVNIVTTGAHIIKGSVYHNMMVDLTVSNNKLYTRAIGIIDSVVKCGRGNAGMY